MTATTAPSSTTPTDGFDAFYRRTRTRLLVQTWALTGDRRAAVKAVRDGYVACAHHWEKVSLLDDTHADTGGSEREDWLRPIAWSRAQSRHTVPHFHRTTETTPEAAATLAAVQSLSNLHRRVLLLAHLSTANLAQLAREVGLSSRRAERELQTAIARFAAHRNVAPHEVQAAFEPLFADAVTQPWPDSNSLLRIGASRRQVHRGIGVATVTAVCIGAGIAVSWNGGGAVQLADKHWGSVTPKVTVPVSTTSLLPMRALSHLGDVRGTVSDGTQPTLPAAAARSSAALVLGCLGTSGTGPAGSHIAAWRTVGKSASSGWVTEAVRSSTDPVAARADFGALQTWYNGCGGVRLQLQRQYQVKGVGVRASLAQLRNFDGDGRTVFVGLAQTGSLVTVVGTSQHADVRAATVTTALASLTQRLCHAQGGAGTCPTHPTMTEVSVPKLAPLGLVGAVDLPVVDGVTAPWSGLPPTKADRNLAATICDHTSFRTAKKSLTRTFLVPDARPKLAATFGITETIGKFSSAGAADAFQDTIKSKIDGCAKDNLGSHISLIPIPGLARDVNAFAWEVRLETDATHSVTFDMAVISAGPSVAQLSFIPDGDHTISDQSFAGLVVRAATRLTSY